MPKEDVENIPQPEEEILEPQITEGEGGEPTETESPLHRVYKEHELDERWKAETEEELVSKTLKSYKEAEAAIKQREGENRILRALLDNQQQLRQPQQPFQPPPQQQQQLTPEEIAAEKFVQERNERFYNERIMPEIQRRDQRIDQLEAQTYVAGQYNSNPIFKQLYDSGELTVAVNMRLQQGYPQSASTIDMAYKDIIAARYPQDIAKAGEERIQQGQKLEQQKKGAFVESGTRSKRISPTSYDQFVKDAESMTAEQAIAEARKRGLI